MNIVDCIAKPVIKGQHGAIVLTNTEAHFWAADMDQKRLGPAHQITSDATALEGRRNREKVDCTAMPFIADHDGCNHRVTQANHPESNVAVGQFTLDILTGSFQVRISPHSCQSSITKVASASRLLSFDFTARLCRLHLVSN